MHSNVNSALWKEVRLSRAISAIANQQFAGSRTVEEQASRDTAERHGLPHSPTTFYMPYSAVRDMSVAGVSGSQYLVSTQNQAPIDTPRESFLFLAGAQRLDDLRGNVTLPRTIADSTGYWLSDEHTVITPSQPTVGAIAIAPKTAGAILTITRDLQREPAVETYLQGQFAGVIEQLEVEAALAGSGVMGQPMGITNTPNVHAATVDATDPWGDILDMVEDIAAAGTEPTAIVTTPAVRRLLQGRSRFTSTDSPVWDGTTVAGIRAYASNACPTGTLIVGDFRQLLFATWGVLQIDVDPYSLFSVGHIKMRVLLRCDVALVRPDAFAVASVS